MFQLTKKQLFDLQFKYSNIRPPFCEGTISKNWWDFRTYWDSVSFDCELTEDFIREYQDYVNWEYISKVQKLSEDFMREFKDKLDWDSIMFYQKLTIEFMTEMVNEGYIKDLLNRIKKET